jgi:hypothetical protein
VLHVALRFKHGVEPRPEKNLSPSRKVIVPLPVRKRLAQDKWVFAQRAQRPEKAIGFSNKHMKAAGVFQQN